MANEALKTVGDVAEILQMHPQTIYRAVKAKQLEGHRIGRAWRFSDEQIRRFVESTGTGQQ